TTAPAATRRRSRSKASSPTWTGGSARPIPTGCATSWRATRPARSATPARAAEWFGALNAKLSQKQQDIAYRILKEINERLGFLNSVGLEYLTLSRGSATLSGGESQRIRLASQIGSGLTGVLYVLDEPSIGLHQRDNDRLLATLKRLRDLGNT